MKPGAKLPDPQTKSRSRELETRATGLMRRKETTVLHSRIQPDGQTRNWCRHGDGVPGVQPDPYADHRDAARLGAFVRIASTDEDRAEALRPLEQPACIVRRTCDPRMIKRSRVAFAPNRSPFPDWYDAGENENWRRPLTPEIVGQARRT
ncbi:MAG: hypothetical protein ACKO1J_09230 [Tagaea sp.]